MLASPGPMGMQAGQDSPSSQEIQQATGQKLQGPSPAHLGLACLRRPGFVQNANIFAWENSSAS